MEEIINRVAHSSLITLDLEDYYPQGERVLYDLKDNLFQGLILKEKDFRAFLKENDWTVYQDKNIALTCSVDAIIPTWAYMLLAIHIEPYANHVAFGDLADLEKSLFQKIISAIHVEDFRDKRVVVKGCGKLPIPEFAYIEITRVLRPLVSSLMFGEPCSTVPLYKKK
jgi:hypothetical protein